MTRCINLMKSLDDILVNLLKEIYMYTIFVNSDWNSDIQLMNYGNCR